MIHERGHVMWEVFPTRRTSAPCEFTEMLERRVVANDMTRRRPALRQSCHVLLDRRAEPTRANPIAGHRTKKVPLQHGDLLSASLDAMKETLVLEPGIMWLISSGTASRRAAFYHWVT